MEGLRTMFLGVVVGLFLLGNSFSYGERTICATYYQKGGAPAVLENPECSSWVLSNNFYRNHTVNCLLAEFTNFEDGKKHFKERFFCDLDLQIPFLGENGSIEDVKVGMVALFDHNGVEDSAKMATNLLKNYFLVHTYFLRDETYAFNKLMGPLSYKEDHDMVFPELSQVNEVDQLIRRALDCSSLWMLPKGVDGTINAKILKEALSRTIHDIDLTLSEVASKQNHVPGCVATVVLMIEGQILVANGCNSKAFLCNWHYVEDEDVWIDLSAKLARRYHSRSLSERTEDGTACVLVGRYGNLAPMVTDWKPLSAVNSHWVLASDEIFKTLNEPDICALLHQKRYKSYWTLTPIPCYFMTPSDADCIVHTAFLKASKEGGIPYDNSRSGYNLSVAVVRLRSAGGFIIH